MTDNDLNTFGNNLKKLRQKTGLSQEDFAEKVGIHRTYISGLERGKRNPTLTLILKITMSMQFKINEIFKDLTQ